MPSTFGGFFSGMIYIQFPSGATNKDIVLVLSASGINQDVADTFEATTGESYPMMGLNSSYRNAVVKKLQALKKWRVSILYITFSI